MPTSLASSLSFGASLMSAASPAMKSVNVELKKR
jgi:hypothetical protein